MSKGKEKGKEPSRKRKREKQQPPTYVESNQFREKMFDIKKKGKINIHWKVTPYDYSKEKCDSLTAKVSKKYGVRKDRVKIIPEFLMVNEEGEEVSVNSNVIGDIQDPQFQLKLFEDWLRINEIKDYDFDLIKKIDAEINGKIDYQVYDKYKRYSIKWVKWDNFLSYGTDNYFDFRTLKGLVLLSGEPANQSGKTTFAIDLLHFLLFGKTTKVPTLDKVFNKHLPNATNVVVEGCITIDGVDYIIKRTLTRPTLGKRTVKSKTVQKVEYYKIVNGVSEELDDYVDNEQEENSAQTNKAIKEAIGKEGDFDLIMSVTESSLDDLVNKKDAERGRLLSRWIGLLPIEEKSILAREKFNSEVKPYLLSNMYNEETLKQENEAFTMTIEALKKDILKYEGGIAKIDGELAYYEGNKAALMSAKHKIDTDVLNVDITTLNAKIGKCIEEGKRKGQELKSINDELAKIGDVEFSVEEFDNVQSALIKEQGEKAAIGEQYKAKKREVEALKSSEYCPTCGRKLDNVDNSAKIREIQAEVDKLEARGVEKKTLVEQLSKELETLKGKRDKYDRRSKYVMSKAAYELTVEKLRNEYKDYASLKKEYEKNSEAIDKNNALDVQIRNIDSLLKGKRAERETNLSYISRNQSEIKNYEEQMQRRKEIIAKMKEEELLVRNWKIYIDLVGKNGISKMVLRKALPIVNARLSELLSDVCDFSVEVGITPKNDVLFYLVKDGVYSDLSSGSGFELTASALALRAVLADLSTIPRCGGLIYDELFGRVSQENYDNMKTLLDKIAKGYDWIFIISHNSEIKSWCTTDIVVKKEDNVSRILKRTIE